AASRFVISIMVASLRSMPIDGEWEIQRSLNFPDLLMPIWRQDADGIAHGDPPDWHHRKRGKMCFQMNNRIHPHLAALAKMRSVEDRGTGGHEHLVFNPAADHMGIRAD